MAQYRDLKEVSAAVGISVTSLRRGIKTGRFKFIRAGQGAGKILLDVEAVAKQLDYEALNSTQGTRQDTPMFNTSALEDLQRKEKVANSFDAWVNKK